MMLLDTHIWVWWVMGDSRLDPAVRAVLDARVPDPIYLSAFSCWEVVKLDERGRITLPKEVGPWLREATAYPRLVVVPVSTDVVVALAELPPGLHRDPADQMIVATARLLDVPLVTVDHLILRYQPVKIYRSPGAPVRPPPGSPPP